MPQQLPISVWPPDTPPLSETIIKSHPSGNKHSAILTRPQLGSAKLRPTSTHVLQFSIAQLDASSQESTEIEREPGCLKPRWERLQKSESARDDVTGDDRHDVMIHYSYWLTGSDYCELIDGTPWTLC
ncbi:hypothetical protein PGTUg99_027653 [Puccinia graminis f. sp. tritici]|uniref:Uncharacterized protein n=1 Tax=Puccinia graminis f. sp. tritici TaxID=56615 RepID=A0A5B0S6D6_PUCGR|nr:hypothetical protein PGTUg99_027653 [Puccinia graminis f. sp. tritici]